MSTPFGLSTKYEPGWVGRYHAIDSTFETGERECLAVRLADWLLAGAEGAVTFPHEAETARGRYLSPDIFQRIVAEMEGDARDVFVAGVVEDVGAVLPA